VLLKSRIFFALTIGILLSSLASPLVHAFPNTVSVTSTSTGDITTLQITNNPSSTSNIFSFTLQIKSGSFLSFKLDNGWQGKKTSSDTIAFFSSNPISPGGSTSLKVRTDQQSPDLVWSAFDANNNELGSGEIGASTTPPSSSTPSSSTPSSSTSSSSTSSSTTGSTTPTQNRGIFSTSSFRIVPSTPSPGFDVRVVGQSFAASTNLDLYVGDQQIDSFSSDSNGNFVETTTLPQTLQLGNTVFVLKDQSGNQVTFSTSINQAPPSRGSQQVSIPLTLNMNSVFHRGDTGIINGTTDPDNTVTISILDSAGNSITTFTSKADSKGNYVFSHTIPVDATLGKYTLVVSDSKDQVQKDFNIVSTHTLSISTSQQKYEPGDMVVINGTSISNELVSIIINDPSGSQVFAKDVNVTSDGTISANFTLDTAAIEGTYVITASQGSDQIPLYFGVGVEPAPILTTTLNKLNYEVTDKPILNISGPPSSTLNLVIIDPSDKEKFSDTVLLGSDGLATYSFNLTSYTPGIYSAVVTRGNDKVVKNFAVGLQIGSGQINIKTIKDTYLPGDNIIILGNSNPNTIIQITLTDPNGIPIKSEQTFTDKNGIFSSFDFRIPSDGSIGTWKLDGTSGINHVSLNLNVVSSTVLTVQVDKTPPNYSVGDLVLISGSGAGKEADITIKILGAGNSVINTLSIQSTNTGSYSTDWNIPKDLGAGTYTIQVEASKIQVSTTITVQ